MLLDYKGNMAVEDHESENMNLLRKIESKEEEKEEEKVLSLLLLNVFFSKTKESYKYF